MLVSTIAALVVAAFVAWERCRWEMALEAERVSTFEEEFSRAFGTTNFDGARAKAETLGHENRRIALANVSVAEDFLMLGTGVENPSPPTAIDFQADPKPFITYRPSECLLGTLLFGIPALVAGWVAAFAVASLTLWMLRKFGLIASSAWYFCLERLRELAKAVRGR
jgi:hypothetical protein